MFKVDYANGTAKEEYVTKKGNKKVNNFKIFLCEAGAFISKRDGIVFLNEENIEIK